MSTFVNGKDIIFTNNTSDPIITLKAAQGKTLIFQGQVFTNAGLNITDATIGSLQVTNIANINNASITDSTITNLLVTRETVSSLNTTTSTITNLYVTSQTSSSLINTNLNSTNATITNLAVSNASFNNLTVTTLLATDSITASNLIITNSTLIVNGSISLLTVGSSATMARLTVNGATNLNNITAANLSLTGTATANNITVSTLLVSSATTTNLNATSATSTNLRFTSSTGTNLVLTALTTSGLVASNELITNSTITSLNTTSITTSGLTASNETITNSTITSLNLTRATATSMAIATEVVTNSTISSLLAPSLTATNLNISSATSTNLVATSSTITGLAATNSVTNRSTITTLNCTNATITNLNLSGITTGTLSLGNVSSGQVVYGTTGGLLTSDSFFKYDPGSFTMTVSTATVPVINGYTVIAGGGSITNKNYSGFVGINTSTTGSTSTFNPTVSSTSRQGYTVSLYNDTLAVANPDDSSLNPTDIGSFSIYRNTVGSWSLEALIAPTYSTCGGNHYGLCKVYSNTLLFASTVASGDTGSSGVYTRTGTTWTNQQQLDKDMSKGIDLGANICCGIGPARTNFNIWTRSGSTWTNTSDTTPGGTLIATACNDTLVAYTTTTGTGTITILNSSGTIQQTLTGNANYTVGTWIAMSNEYLVSVSSGYVIIYRVSDWSIVYYTNMTGITLVECTINQRGSGADMVMVRSSTTQYFIKNTSSGSWILEDTTSSTKTLSYASVNSFSAYGNNLSLGFPTNTANRGLFVITGWTTVSDSSVTSASEILDGNGLYMTSTNPIIIQSSIPSLNASYASLTIPNGGLSAAGALITNSQATNMTISTLNCTNDITTNSTISSLINTTLTNTNLTSSASTITNLKATNTISWSGRAYGYVLGTGGMTIANGTDKELTSLYWNSSVTTNGSVTYTAGKFSVPRAGVYTVCACVNFASNSTGVRSLYITKNSSTGLTTRYGYINAPPVSGDRTGLATSALVDCSANDTISVIVWQNSGSSLAMDSTINGRFSVIEEAS